MAAIPRAEPPWPPPFCVHRSNTRLRTARTAASSSRGSFPSCPCPLTEASAPSFISLVILAARSNSDSEEMLYTSFSAQYWLLKGERLLIGIYPMLDVPSDVRHLHPPPEFHTGISPASGAARQPGFEIRAAPGRVCGRCGTKVPADGFPEMIGPHHGFRLGNRGDAS